MKKNRKIKGVSLFANVGIAETYLDDTNIEISVANELLEDRSMFYKYMYPKTNVIVGDINNDYIYNEILENSLKEKCDFVLITPPCQGMSVAGKMDKNDPRNLLIVRSVDFVKDLRPRYVIIENVPGIINTYIKKGKNKIKITDYIISELQEYNIDYKIMDVADYGTPQHRKRAIFLISRKDTKKLDFPKKHKKLVTVRETIEHLPTIESGEISKIKFHFSRKHNERHILWMKNTPTGKTALENKVHFPVKENGEKIKGYLTTYKRIEWDKPAPTITMANGSISSQNNVHPGRLKKDGTYSDARVLSLKEIFLLTGLPENWTPPYWASENLIRKVIGEGIPPRMIFDIVKQIS